MVAKELTTTPCRCDEAANRTKMGQRHRKAAPAQGTTQRRVSRLLLSYCFQVASFQHCHSSSHIVSSSSGLSIDEEFIRLRSVISQNKKKKKVVHCVHGDSAAQDVCGWLFPELASPQGGARSGPCPQLAGAWISRHRLVPQQPPGPQLITMPRKPP